MKICFITTAYGTISSFVLPVIPYLHEHTDWDISVICTQPPAEENQLPDYVHYFPVEMKRGISIAGIKACKEIKKIFMREKFDFIQYSTPNASLYASLAGKAAKIPMRLYCQWGLVYVGMSGLKRKLFRMEERYVCHLSTWVEPDSHGNLDFSHDEKLYPLNKGSVVGHGSAIGVDFNKFDITKKQEYRNAIRKKYNIPQDAFVFVFVGRVHKDKGIDELIEAYKNDFAGKDNRLILVGREELTERLNQELFLWSKNADDVIYTGEVNNVEQFLAASDCFVMPSYREGFGMGTIEAEAMGLPVVVTDIPGPREAMIDGKTGFLARVKDVSSLRTAMKRVREMNTENMGNAGYNFVEENFERNNLMRLILEDRIKLAKEYCDYEG